MSDRRAGRAETTTREDGRADAEAAGVTVRGRLVCGVAGVLLVAAVTALVVTAVVTLHAASPGYSYRHSMISDLGSRTCVLRGGHRMCSPRAAWFNGGLVASGLLLGTAAWLVRRIVDRVALGAFATMAAGLLLLGVVGSDVNHPIHMAGAVLALLVPSALFTASAVSARAISRRSRAGTRPVQEPRGRPPRRLPSRPGWWPRDPPGRLRAAMAVVALALCLDHLPGDEHAPVPRGIAELGSAGALCLIVLIDAARLLSARRALDAPPPSARCFDDGNNRLG